MSIYLVSFSSKPTPHVHLVTVKFEEENLCYRGKNKRGEKKQAIRTNKASSNNSLALSS